MNRLTSTHDEAEALLLQKPYGNEWAYLSAYTRKVLLLFNKNIMDTPHEVCTTCHHEHKEADGSCACQCKVAGKKE